MENLMYLKSGTDIRGTAMSKDGGNIDLTDSRIESIIFSFVHFLKQKLKKDGLSISVGYDSRLTSKHISEVVEKALLSLDVSTYDCGLSSTPSMFMSIINFGLDAAVEITASHLPYEMNGLKFFTKDGGFSGGDIKEILSFAEKNPYSSGEALCELKTLDNMGAYSAALRKMICLGLCADEKGKPLSGLKIAVDAGNGVGAFYAKDVLGVLGANIDGSCFLEPDGHFPNHIPNPENKVAMDFISRAVTNSGSDIGIIFDTDCDRAACVDKTGEEINRNKLVALASYLALNGRLNTGAVIVTDSVTSDGLSEFLTKDLGAVHRRFKRGYKNVIDEAKRLTSEGKNVPLAIETSGHAAFSENYYLDDGAYLVTKIIIEAARLKKTGETIDSVIKTLKLPKEEKELRFKILLDDFRAFGENVINGLGALAEKTDYITVAPDNFEGVRINFDKTHGDGWLLLRMSVHEPLLVLNSESASFGGVEKMLGFFKNFISAYKNIDISALCSC